MANWFDEQDVAGGAFVAFSSACGYVRSAREDLLQEPETLELLFKEFREMAVWMSKLYTQVQGLEDVA